jgi:hypothetical protein
MISLYVRESYDYKHKGTFYKQKIAYREQANNVKNHVNVT